MLHARLQEIMQRGSRQAAPSFKKEEITREWQDSTMK